jgi:hypothetical protein
MGTVLISTPGDASLDPCFGATIYNNALEELPKRSSSNRYSAAVIATLMMLLACSLRDAGWKKQLNRQMAKPLSIQDECIRGAKQSMAFPESH